MIDAIVSGLSFPSKGSGPSGSIGSTRGIVLVTADCQRAVEGAGVGVRFCQ